MSYADPGRAPQAHLSREEAPQEPTGPVASDSLAAESTRAGEGFSENENPDILGVKGASSTLNNTDTSGASELQPAPSGAEREKQDELSLGSNERGEAGGVKYPEATGQPQFEGATNLDGYTGGPSSGKSSTAYDTSSAGGGGTGDDSGSADVGQDYDIAPTSQSGILPPGSQQPKGSNLTEGGFSETGRSADDIGGPNDPGRLAEQEFENADSEAVTGAALRDMGKNDMTDKGGFEVLRSERA